MVLHLEYPMDSGHNLMVWVRQWVHKMDTADTPQKAKVKEPQLTHTTAMELDQMVQVWGWEPPEVWEYLSLPGTKPMVVMVMELNPWEATVLQLVCPMDKVLEMERFPIDMEQDPMVMELEMVLHSEDMEGNPTHTEAQNYKLAKELEQCCPVKVLGNLLIKTICFTGYGGPAGVPNGQLAKAANTGYDMMPNSKGIKSAGAYNEKGLKGGVLSPEQLSATPQAITEGAAPVSPEPTRGIRVMVTQDKYQKLPSPVPQGKSYKQTPLILQATPEPAPAIPQGKGPKPAPAPRPEPGPMGPQGKAPKTNPAPQPQGYVTGIALPEQKGAEADALFEEGPSEGDAAPESTKHLKTKAVPETVAAKNTGRIIPEEALAVGVPEFAPEEANIRSHPGAGSVKGLTAGETGATEHGGGASISKGQGAKPTKPDCGPSGVPNGQWMKIPRSGYNAGAGASAGTNTKGYGAGAGVPNRYGAKPNRHAARTGGYPNGGGAKANKPGYGVGGDTVPGRSNGYADLGYPNAGQPKQPRYGQGAYLGAGYGNTYGGMSQFEPQSAGLGPNGKLGSMYGGMGGWPFGGQNLGMAAEKSNGKYGIGGLQFGGQPLSTETNGAGKYGYGGSPYGPAGDGKSSTKYGGVGAGMGGDPAPAQYGYGGFPNGGQLLGLGSNGNTAGKYGYGRMPFEAQPAGLSPEAISTGEYGLPGSPYQPEPLGQYQTEPLGQYQTEPLGQYQTEPLGLGQLGKLTGKYRGGEVPYAPQTLGFRSEAKPFGKYDNQGPYQSQPLESGGQYDAAGLPYDPLPLEPHSAGKSYVNEDVQTPAFAAEGDGMSIDRYNVAFPAAPSPSPTLVYPSDPSYLPVEFFKPDVVPGAGVEDLREPVGTAGLAHGSAETQGVAQVPEQPDDLLHQQQLPRRIHIQQHLKLHFHPQEEKSGKYDLNGFFGNSGYQG
ncbi:calymmin [Anarrhichthys ocellatus]|uniref:calymmin n=1 Tax=Anarrhichthys ocellatus TaxID=433405 RepID=UPI0012ED0F0C|nr:spidroin-2-like [Anarrhichthys ocellatus]